MKNFLHEFEPGFFGSMIFPFQLNIYFSSMTVETIYETPEYTFLSFLSSIGGDLSLYIGITILSFFEVAEFFVRLCIGGITKKTI